MKLNKLVRVAISVYIILVAAAYGQDAATNQTDTRKDSVHTPQMFLKSLVGSWEGTCRTWFQPGKLADQSKVKGEFKFILGGRFLRHTYQGELQNKPRIGEETIAYNSVSNKFQTAWVDDFHMNYGIMFSEGNSTKTGFVVMGQYAVGPDQPSWGWKTVFELIDKDHLIITAYNISPDGKEAKAVETKYTRTTP